MHAGAGHGPPAAAAAELLKPPLAHTRIHSIIIYVVQHYYMCKLLLSEILGLNHTCALSFTVPVLML